MHHILPLQRGRCVWCVCALSVSRSCIARTSVSTSTSTSTSSSTKPIASTSINTTTRKMERPCPCPCLNVQRERRRYLPLELVSSKESLPHVFSLQRRKDDPLSPRGRRETILAPAPASMSYERGGGTFPSSLLPRNKAYPMSSLCREEAVTSSLRE